MNTTRIMAYGIAATVCSYFGITRALAQSNCANSQNWSPTWNIVQNNVTKYIVGGNLWGKESGAQLCFNVNTSTGNFSVTSETDPNGMGAYPNILMGQSYGEQSTNSGMPIQVSAIKSLPMTWNITTASGSWDAAIEFWATTYNPNGQQVQQANGVELMIWLNSAGQTPGGLNVFGQASIAGTLWDVRASYWHNASSSYPNIYWNYVAYMPACGSASSVNCGDPQQYSPLLNSINTDFRAFFDDALTRNVGSSNPQSGPCSDPTTGSNACLDPSWYVTSVQAGFEIFGQGTGLASSNFTASVNGTVTPLIGQIAAAVDSNGAIELVYPEFDGKLKYTYEQCSSNCGFASEQALGGVIAKQVAMARNNDYTLQTYYNDPTNHYLYTARQNAPGSGNWGTPTQIKNGSSAIVAKNLAAYSMGYLGVFYADNSNGLHYVYPTSSTTWSSQQTISGASANQIAVGYYTENTVVFYTNPSTNNLRYRTQSLWGGPTSSWSAEQTVKVGSNTATATQIAFEPSQTGVLFIDTSGTLNYATWNGATFSGAAAIGNAGKAKRFTVSLDSSTGVLRLTYVGTDNYVHMLDQVTWGDLSKWNTGVSLNIPVRDIAAASDGGGDSFALYYGLDGSLQYAAPDFPGGDPVWTFYMPGNYTWTGGPAGRSYVVSP